jgi:membrane protease YdiL (CAAX protease family)
LHLVNLSLVNAGKFKAAINRRTPNEVLIIHQPLRTPGYLHATRHPWPTLLIMLPLLIVYEAGVLWLGGAKPEMLRNGADAWLRMALESIGLHQMLVAPALIAVFFAVWSYVRRGDRPDGLLGVCSGMLLECFLFALALWGLSHGFAPFLNSLGISLNVGSGPDPTIAKLITFVGAGIYEEILFRLILFSGLAWLLRQALMPKFVAVILAAIVSAFLFATAHHVGAYGEKMDSYRFLFRTMAGIYFAIIYQFRGFGIAVGAHACYDVLVGLSPNS